MPHPSGNFGLRLLATVLFLIMALSSSSPVQAATFLQGSQPPFSPDSLMMIFFSKFWSHLSVTRPLCVMAMVVMNSFNWSSSMDLFFFHRAWTLESHCLRL